MARRKVAVDAKRAAYFASDVVEMRIRKLKELMYYEPVELNDWQIRQAYYHGPEQYEFIDEDFRPFKVGETWGGHDDITAFLKCETTVPQSYDGHPLYLEMYINGYSLLKMNGRPLQGLDFYRQMVLLSPKAKAGEKCLFEIEAAVKNKPYENWYGDRGNVRIFTKSRLVKVDKDIDGLYYDLDLAMKACKAFEERPELQDFVFDKLSQAIKLFDLYEYDTEKFKAGVIKARDYLKKELYENSQYKPVGDIKIVAQSHLDLVYLWPYKETIRKNARTTATNLRLADEYPEYSFLQSQAKLYEDLETYFPQLYDDVQKYHKQGNWEITGGLYVEPDCNLPSGESFVRQILFGKRYMKEKFGIDSTICWLPDVFGMTCTMPQILLKSGLKFTTSIKLTTWNDTNEFPHHTFWWKGLDGSKLFVHFPTTHFNWGIEPKIMLDHWNKYNQKQVNGESMMMGGLGDGGSGMTRENVEHIRRMKNFPGLPACEFETAESWFNRQWDKHADNPDQLPEWYDELYMEGHRGTFTTAALIKKLNRQCEFLYRDAEFFSVFADKLGLPYDREKLHEGMKTVLIHQFHDTLPGTHPQEAFVWATDELKEAKKLGEDIRRKALTHIAKSVKTEGDSLVLFNSLPWERTDKVCVKIRCTDDFKLVDPQGNEVGYQVISQANGEKEIIFIAKDIPSMGYATYRIEKGVPITKQLMTVTDKQMENRFFNISFADNGCISGIYDKVNDREVLPEGSQANEFQLFEDIPGPFCAWDIIREYKDKQWPLNGFDEVKVIEQGPVRVVLEMTKTFAFDDPGKIEVNIENQNDFIDIQRKDDSKIVQRIVLYNDIARIDFETYISWHETQKLLKVAFPVNVFSKTATYDIAFGNIERPTHYNTSWDEAKFEVCGHKWADLSEGDYGVSILNDCKYGWDIYDNTMRLTLLKAPTRPSLEMDRGEHEFTYTLYPHKGAWRDADTFRQAYQLNVPIVTVQQGANDGELPPTHSFLEVDSDNVFVEAVKLAEDSDDVIIRLCEYYRQRGKTTLNFDRKIKSAKECNLMEQNESKVSSKGEELPFNLDPYELKTFKMRFEEL